MSDGRCLPERDIFIGLHGSEIVEVSPFQKDHQSSSRQFIDAQSSVALPGLVNAHTHLAMTLFRGLEDDVPFHDWLFKKILPLEARIVDRDFVSVGTELALLESLSFGVTTVVDMYFYADTVCELIDQAGSRAWVAQVCADGPLPEDKVLGSDKARLFRALHSRWKNHPRITPTLGPHAPYTCSDATLSWVRDLSAELSSPVQIHLCETRKEVDDSLKEFGKTPVQRLNDLGFLGPRTLCAHCVHLSEVDIDIMKNSKASIVHNPDSNLKLSSGLAPIVKYRKSGIPVALGTDGAASNNNLNLFGAMDLATKLQKLNSGDNTAMVASDALLCATWEGARALGLQDRIGSLEVGKQADLILVNLDHPHLQPVYDVRSQLVYSAQGNEVEKVFCAGKLLFDKGDYKTLDRERIMRETQLWRKKIAP